MLIFIALGTGGGKKKKKGFDKREGGSQMRFKPQNFFLLPLSL